jgi:FixJ family two-component response regulator
MEIEDFMNCNNKSMKRIAAAQRNEEYERQSEEEKRQEAEYFATLTPEERQIKKLS